MAPRLCNCTGVSGNCESLKPPQVVCHGPVDDDSLRRLFSTIRVSINPILEPAGVATKTCRSLALGVPVVSTERDGTFAAKPPTPAGRICRPADAECFEQQLRTLLTDDAAWAAAAAAGPAFIEQHYGVAPFREDVANLFRRLRAAPIRVAIEGDALRSGESAASQNWHLLRALSNGASTGSGSVLEVSAAGAVSPPIASVLPLASQRTGYQLNVLVRHGSPPSLDRPSASHCGPGCRVALILPWEFGALPRAWLSPIAANVDELWAPSRASAAAYFASGVGSESVRVVPSGFDCEAMQPSGTSPARSATLPVAPMPAASATVAAADSATNFTFVFTGGLLPRSGIDVLIQAWLSVFCPLSLPLQRRIVLRVHLQDSGGFDPSEERELEEIARRCGNVEWRRGALSTEEHRALLAGANAYVAPARAEGLALPVVEAMALGLPVITTVSDNGVVPAAADDVFSAEVGFPVRAKRSSCQRPPCTAGGGEVCVEPPCMQQPDGRWRCGCIELLRPATWFDPQPADVAEQLRAIVMDDAERSRRADAARRLVASSLCWPLAASNHRSAIEALAGEKRSDAVAPALPFVPPIEQIWRRQQRFVPAFNPDTRGRMTDGSQEISAGRRRVVIALTTNAIQIHHLAPVLSSLCEQTRRPDLVYVTVPYAPRHLRQQLLTVPLFFANFSHCVRLHFMPDFGPAIRLLGAAEMEEDPHTMIVAVDDDKIYSKRMIETLTTAAVANPGAAVGFAGGSLTATSVCFYQGCGPATYVPVSVLEGFAGALYPRRALGRFSQLRRMVGSAPIACVLSDDLLLSNWLSLQGVPRVRVLGADRLAPEPMVEAGSPDEQMLHRLRNHGRQMAWHPEEMRKHRGCLLSGYVDNIAAEGLAMLRLLSVAGNRANDVRTSSSTPSSSCAKFCYPFNLSSSCDQTLQTTECQAGAYFDELGGLWCHRPGNLPAAA